MQKLLADFHVHTLLSPCAAVEMTPNHIILRASQYGIGAVAITDHNASGNVGAALEAGEKYGVKVFPGMEVECQEEAHIVALFDTLQQLQQWQSIVDRHMNGLANNSEKFGAQFIVDAEDNFVREEERLLLAPISLTAAQVVEQVNAIGGIAIAAHVDRPAYSLVGQLGFIEPDFGLVAAEISNVGWKKGLQSKLQRVTGFLPYVTDSDAHNIVDFLQGPKNLLSVENLNVKEIALALNNSQGRSIKPGHFTEFEYEQE